MYVYVHSKIYKSDKIKTTYILKWRRYLTINSNKPFMPPPHPFTQFSYILFISSNYYYAHDFRSEWYFFFVANAIFLAATFVKAIYRQRYCHQTHSPRCPSCSLHRKIPAYEYNCKFCPRKLNRSFWPKSM